MELIFLFPTLTSILIFGQGFFTAVFLYLLFAYLVNSYLFLRTQLKLPFHSGVFLENLPVAVLSAPDTSPS